MKPSIKITVVLIVVGAVLLGTYFIFNQSHRETEVTLEETVARPQVSLTFTYPTGESGLRLIEPPTTENTSLLEAFVLMPFADFEARENGETPGEAPASISIFVFAETDQSAASETSEVPSAANEARVGRVTRLQNWAAANQNLTSFSQAKNTPEVVDLDGVSALYYEADGLYQQQMYLATYKGNIYMFVGQYDSTEDPIYQQFKDLMTTVLFE